jgi:HEPN domain-containing protein
MKKSVHDWLRKAEADAVSARREFRARKQPNYDSACFHAQQCIEKCLKALIDSSNRPMRKVHDLVVLMRDVVDRHASLELLRDDLELLSQFATSFRYPGSDSTREQAALAVRAMDRCRIQILAILKVNILRSKSS